MMKNLNIKNFVYTVIIVFILISFSIISFFDLKISSLTDFIGLITNVFTIEMFLIFLFVKYMWKWRIFRQWLVPFPDLNGTWIGYIDSNWRNPKTGEYVQKIPVMLVIYQTFTSISCVMHTQEMKSYSILEGFNIQSEQQIRQFAYIFSTDPRLLLSDRNIRHNGTMMFDIIGEKEIKLKGKYWTDRNTQGEITLVIHSYKRLHEIPDILGNHPLADFKKPL